MKKHKKDVGIERGVVVAHMFIKLLAYNLWYEKLVYYNCCLNKMGKIGYLISLFNNIFLRIFFNCDIIPSAVLGKGVKIPHCVGIVIGGTAIIGEKTVIMPNVVIGAKYYPPKTGGRRHPMIGKNCLIGANSVILGPINIGDNCIIGAGAFIDKNVPDNSIITGPRNLI